MVDRALPVTPRTSRRIVVIINPLSGRGRGAARLQQHTALAHTVIESAGFDAEVRVTTRGGDATRFAQDAVANGAACVVAWGGDGTVNEVASALVHTPVPLAVVPAGSGNGLALDLGVPFDPQAALAGAVTGERRAIDVGFVDDNMFFNIAGVGVDAVIAARFATRGLHQRGLSAYLTLAAAELWRTRAASYRLTIDGDALAPRAMLIAMANGRQYGNRLRIAPGARLDDGLLEVVIVEPLPLRQIAWRLPSLFRGTLRSGGGVTMRAARAITLESDAEIAYHVDGEPRHGGRRVAAGIHPKALQVKVPFVT